uniref:Uncharacterized protein n=1 Tax=Anguilla anguilla TaxID=7936 RepID=A0A0E9S6L8_ANGAN
MGQWIATTQNRHGTRSH